MRILTVRIRNLNSLRGEHTIDFTAAPLANHSLYAIVGPTGAGKTTILDAITLALYGQTERNRDEKDRQDGSGTVMTHGEADCYAELEYETASGRYLSRWTRHRARRKTSGNLVASQHSISEWRPDDEEDSEPYKILATKKKEVAVQTLEVVGLDYDRFVRSVMLTQGDFARFLRSNPGDKAKILEKITGTEVYHDLSVAAFRRAKLAREAHQRALDLAGSRQPLGADERAQLETQLAATATSTATHSEALRELTGQLSQLDQLREATARTTTAQAAASTAQSAFRQLEPERQRLARSESLEALRADLTEADRLRAEQRSITARQDALRAEEQRIIAQRDTARTAVQTVNDELNAYYEKLPGREERIAKAAALEQEVLLLNQDLRIDKKRRDSLQQDLQKQTAKRAAAERRVAETQALLADRTPASIQAEVTQLEAALPRAAARIQQLERSVAAARLVDRLNVVTAELVSSEKDLAVATAAFATAEAALRAASEETITRRQIVSDLQVAASLAEHKQNLRPGEPCPVCGATEHPDSEPVVNSRVDLAVADVNRALRAEEAARERVANQRRSLEVLRRTREGKQTLATDLKEQLTAYVEVPGDSVADLERQAADLTRQHREQTAACNHLRELQTRLPELARASSERTTILARMAELERELGEVSTLLTTKQEVHKNKRASIRKAVGNKTAEERREQVRQEKAALDAQLMRAEKEELAVAGEQKALSARATLIADQLAANADATAQLAQRLQRELTARDLDEAAARRALLSPAETATLRGRLDEAAAARAKAENNLATLTEEVQRLQKATAAFPDREALDARRIQTDHELTEANKQIGALRLRVQQDDERRAAVAEQRERLAGLSAEADRWATMSRLIGSADGKKFRSYAQAITLQRLITVGNDHLTTISPRYRMEYVPPAGGANENLEIAVIDTYQDDNRRTVSTLSGGETFLISLALALGLSDLASGKNLIQSLFIDEGFGTLDGKTLDKAMTTLEQLRDQGKTIGLISHVASLRERIQCQIRLVPVGDGFSRIETVD